MCVLQIKSTQEQLAPSAHWVIAEVFINTLSGSAHPDSFFVSAARQTNRESEKNNEKMAAVRDVIFKSR